MKKHKKIISDKEKLRKILHDIGIDRFLLCLKEIAIEEANKETLVINLECLIKDLK